MSEQNHTNEERIAAIRAAADWIAANPDKLAFQVFAADYENVPVPISSPDAVCFCALGRIIVEAGLAGSSSSTVRTLQAYLDPLGINASRIARRNDAARTEPAVRRLVVYLRSLADKAEAHHNSKTNLARFINKWRLKLSKERPA